MRPATPVLCAVVALCSVPVLAIPRAFVASYGNDADPCTREKPCRSFAAAIAVSTGEVVAIDSAGYGIFTVSKSVAIVAPPGVHAGISVFPGATGVTIDGSGIAVTLRNLYISSQGGVDGISAIADDYL